VNWARACAIRASRRRWRRWRQRRNKGGLSKE
jgi:hypothetical protein